MWAHRYGEHLGELYHLEAGVPADLRALALQIAERRDALIEELLDEIDDLLIF